jgi:integrase
MARKIKGAVVEHVGGDGCVYRALRFTAYKKRRYVSLGEVSEEEAQRALRHVLADVERGTWQLPREIAGPGEPAPVPTFHAYAEQWWILNQQELAPSTRVDYRWRLEGHLLPFFADYQLDAITFDLVEHYIAAKLAEDKPLSPRSVNMTLTLMAAILESAVERELIARNPAKGKNRRVRERAPRRTYLETAEQIEALLAAGGDLDALARRDRQHISRRAVLATLMFAGLRIGELCGLRWRDVDLATGWLHVGDAKTDAGIRKVKIRGTLRDELAGVRAARTRHTGPADYVFATSTGARQSRENLRNRVLAPAVRRASERLVEAGSWPMPDGLTPHSLRRTFASVLYALGEDPGVVMDEMGHTDPALALRVYRQTMRRGEDEKARLRALVEGGEQLVDAVDPGQLHDLLEELVDVDTAARILALIPAH